MNMSLKLYLINGRNTHRAYGFFLRTIKKVSTNSGILDTIQRKVQYLQRSLNQCILNIPGSFVCMHLVDVGVSVLNKVRFGG